MNIINVRQGSPEWLAVRAQHFTASEAPAMMGLSKYQSRSDLLKQKATGIAPDVDGFKQALFDKGHESEASGRPMAEEIVGELYPVTASLEVDGLKLLASLDGATMMEDDIFEHKLWSESLAAQVDAGELSPHYTVQMDQQLLVSGARRCLFMTSDGTPQRMAWCWYETNREKLAALIAGWKQFAVDLATYNAPAAVAPVAAGKAPESLPALRIEINGAVTASNLDAFKATALAAIRGVNRDLKTDIDFANAESAVKWCSDVESRLAAAREHALSQTASIDELFKAIGDISEEARRVRLDLEKLVKARKESIRGEIVAGAVQAFTKHVRALNASLGRVQLPQIHADFAGVIKGKRTVASLQDAVDTELARVKIEASSVHLRMDANLRTIDAQEAHAFLFSDVAQLVAKAPDDLALLIKSRIAEHEAKEAKRLEAQREADARAAETLRLQRVEDARVAAEAAAALAAAAPAPVPVAPIAASVSVAAPVVAPAPAIVPLQRAAAPAPSNELATLNLGAICARLGFTVTAAFMSEQLRIQPAAVDKSARLYRESQWPLICAALTRHIAHVCELQAA
jgi:putative phage-type endonuclease